MSDFTPGWMQAAFAADLNPSFADLVRRVDPDMLPVNRMIPGGGGEPAPLPHGTTILAMRFDGGVVVAGDRRATEGMTIANRRMEKVFPADAHSAVAIAGVAATAMDMVKLLSTELEHYEKVEGERLSLDGKANKLAQIIKANFPMAMQGLIVVPLFAGYDLRRGMGRLFRFDAVGGRYEDTDYHAVGSGGVHARGTLKKRWREGLSEDEAVAGAIEALLDASEEDAATGGPDLLRNIFPVIAVVTADGYRQVEDATMRPIVESLIDQRRYA